VTPARASNLAEPVWGARRHETVHRLCEARRVGGPMGCGVARLRGGSACGGVAATPRRRSVVKLKKNQVPSVRRAGLRPPGHNTAPFRLPQQLVCLDRSRSVLLPIATTRRLRRCNRYKRHTLMMSTVNPSARENGAANSSQAGGGGAELSERSRGCTRE
jgi:hypothetical protein